ncbi:MAG TPA: hypothetical protein DCS89_19330 [Gammaproteobacteria bacterium]|nr:hypothetical protein [Gammaproteobacteria bacterium]
MPGEQKQTQANHGTELLTDKDLGARLSKQRKTFRKGKLTEGRVRRLKDLGALY